MMLDPGYSILDPRCWILDAIEAGHLSHPTPKLLGKSEARNPKSETKPKNRNTQTPNTKHPILQSLNT
jgi:hypothetical protein